MKQPKIKIFGNEYKVMQIEYNKKGFIERIVYEENEYTYRTVFRDDKILKESLVGVRKIQKPTKHPYQDYIHAPNLEILLIEQS